MKTMEQLLKSELIDAAQRGGDWLLRNQINNSLDANNGRFLYCYNLKTGYVEMSTGWQTAMGVIALLWLYQINKDKKYLDSAIQAASYILSLQILDPERPKLFGAFREETPQSHWLHPRDSTSDGWGLVVLYSITKNEQYLKAAKRFADWHLKYAWHSGWPVATVQIDHDGYKDDNSQLNCQCGTAGFFMQLAQAANEKSYLENGAKPILDYYIEHLLDKSGQPHIFYDPVNDVCDKNESGFPQAWVEMHRYNDDFAALSLLQGYLTMNNPKYLAAAQLYAQWACKGQNANGSFGNPEVEVASSCIPLFLLDLINITNEKQYEPAINLALRHLLTLQIKKDDDIHGNGGFLCLNNHCQRDPNTWVNIRNTAYSIVALLKAAGYTGPALQTTL